MNQYITNNQPNENLTYVLDYLGLSVDEFLKMTDEEIISIYKRSADALNDGVMTKNGGQNKSSHRETWLRQETEPTKYAGDSGSKSRYFDIDVWAEKHGLLQFPKASKRERNEGCEGLEEKRKCYMAKANGTGEPSMQTDNFTSFQKNHHPTVKPVHLMAWLVRLVSKEGDTVLDPFMGSGTTGVACKKLGRDFIGIELSEDYLKIAEARITSVKKEDIQYKLLE